MEFRGFEHLYSQYSPLVEDSAQKVLNFQELSNGITNAVKIQCAYELSLLITVNKAFHMSLVASPLHVEPLIVGFLLAEGIIEDFGEETLIEFVLPNLISVTTGKGSIVVSTLEKKGPITMELGTSGALGIKELNTRLGEPIVSDLKITPEKIFRAQDALIQSGVIWKITGGAHMSGLFDGNGNTLFTAEDVGRHNTLDKVIGHAVLNKLDVSNCFIITSGRLSGAMVRKVVRAKIPILISRAAPMNEGIEIARQYDLTLVGFTRFPALNVYSKSDRILL